MSTANIVCVTKYTDINKKLYYLYYGPKGAMNKYDFIFRFTLYIILLKELGELSGEHPLSLFTSMLRSPESKRQYPGRLQVFFNFLKIEGSIEEQAVFFMEQYKHQDGESLERKLIMFAGFQKQRVENKEISPSTIPNYFKAIKLFCEVNRIGRNVAWKVVSKALPRGFHAADDRAPTIEEIQKLMSAPDRRIKPLVTTLVSSGCRIGAFETLKWKHILPITNNSDEVIAAKIRVYVGDREEYYSFLTGEAYQYLLEWMDYRNACGEEITGESLVMRDIWQSDDLEGAKNPKPLNSFAITRLLNRAWQVQKIRPSLSKGKRHEFKTAHGFRKYFKTQMEQARVPSIKVELFLGHSLGVTDSYARFSEEQMLQDYLIGSEYLTVNQTIVLINKNLKKQEETIQKTFKEMEEKQKAELSSLQEKYYHSLEEQNTAIKKLQDRDEEIKSLIKKQEQFEQLLQTLIDTGKINPVAN